MLTARVASVPLRCRMRDGRTDSGSACGDQFDAALAQPARRPSFGKRYAYPSGSASGLRLARTSLIRRYSRMGFRWAIRAPPHRAHHHPPSTVRRKPVQVRRGPATVTGGTNPRRPGGPTSREGRANVQPGRRTLTRRPSRAGGLPAGGPPCRRRAALGIRQAVHRPRSLSVGRRRRAGGYLAEAHRNPSACFSSSATRTP
jgi:hypothetical protein